MRVRSKYWVEGKLHVGWDLLSLNRRTIGRVTHGKHGVVLTPALAPARVHRLCLDDEGSAGRHSLCDDGESGT